MGKDKEKDWNKDNESMEENVAPPAADSEDTEKKDAYAAIERFANDEDDEDDLGNISIRSILGGDILQSSFFLKQVVFIFFVVILMLIYTGNRYSGQQDIITIDSLKNELQNECYNVLTQKSELMNMKRQSKVEELLRSVGDTTLLSSQTPPYVIKN